MKKDEHDIRKARIEDRMIERSEMASGVGKACYEAWVDSLDSPVGYSPWDRNPEKYQLAWIAAAKAAIEAHRQLLGEIQTDPSLDKLKNDLRCAVQDFKARVNLLIWQFEYGGQR